jgi:transcriptional regulator with XRE-family HTH domain
MQTRLKEIREIREMTTCEFANLLGCAPSYLNEIENGKKFPSRKMIEQFSKVLDVKVTKLIKD